MNKLNFRLLCLMAASFLPMLAIAQSNIKTAFDAIINCKEADVTSSHKLDKDPESFVKKGQCDIYRFTLPEKKASLLKNLLRAFDKDAQHAYSIESGKSKKNDRSIYVAVGDGSGTGVNINEPGYDYIYELFLAPKAENPDGIYRYAYGLCYKENGGKIEGKFIVTYATTLKYRQGAQNSSFTRLPGGALIINGTDQTWFEKLMSNLNSMTSANSRTRLSLATKAFALIQNMGKYPEVTANEKKAAQNIIQSMRSQSKYSDPQLNSILQQCEEALQ